MGGLSTNEINLLNPPEETYFAQLNILRDIFENDYENVMMMSSIKNTAVMFFASFTGMGTYNNVNCISGNMELSASSETSLDECDSLTNWDEAPVGSNRGVLSLNTNSDHYVESTGSIQAYVDSPSAAKTYEIEKTITSADWSAYEQLKVWIKSTHTDNGNPVSARLGLKEGGDAIQYSSYVEIGNGAGYYTFDVSALSRTAVTQWSVEFYFTDSETHYNYVDDLNGTDTDTYQTSGWWQCPGRTLPTDVSEVFCYEKIADLPEGASRTVKVSLDGGTNWHTLTGMEFGTWLDVTAWAEYEDFTVKNEFSMRVELDSTDDAVTPKYDDIMVAYKF